MPGEHLKKQIEERWNSLTKPPGSLGRLEDLVTRYTMIRGEVMPVLERKGMYLFCALCPQCPPCLFPSTSLTRYTVDSEGSEETHRPRQSRRLSI